MHENLFGVLKESIPILGIILTALITLTVLKHENWVKAVSSSRNHWLNEFRNEASIVVGTINMIKNYVETTTKDEKKVSLTHNLIYEAEVAKAKLITRLNTNKIKGNEYNMVLKNELSNIIFKERYLKNYNVVAFLELINIILEIEWKKVKRESKGEIE